MTGNFPFPFITYKLSSLNIKLQVRNDLMTFYLIQLLRFIAAILVLLFHLNLAKSGYKGVDIFFVISGFVLYLTLFHKTYSSPYKFFIHRITKIYILYWIVLIGLYFLQPFNLDQSFIGTFLLIPGHKSVLGVSWSLSYILYFYFIAGTISFAVPERIHKKLFIILFIASSAISFLNLIRPELKGSLPNFLLGHNFWEFLLGNLCGILSQSRMNFLNNISRNAIGILAFLLFIIIGLPFGISYSFVIYGILSMTIVFMAITYEQNNQLDSKLKKLFKLLGDSSYCIYLIGPLVIILSSGSNHFSRLTILIITIIFSIFFHQIVEKSILRWSRNILLMNK